MSAPRRILVLLIMTLWVLGCLSAGSDWLVEDRVSQIEDVGALLARRANESIVQQATAQDEQPAATLPPPRGAIVDPRALVPGERALGPCVVPLANGVGETSARGPPQLA